MNPASATAITNPFPGLRPFREEEEHLFFGREHQVDALVDKLAERRFLAVVGTSGSGKSSLVNCGLRPALHQGRMASAGTSWRMAQFRPGNHSLAAMAKALAEDGVLFRNFEARGLPLLDIIDTTLRMSKRGLIDIVEQAALAKDVNLLVVVDQFEELFRYRQLVDVPQAGGPQADGHGFSEEASAFVKLLLELQEQKDCPIFVVLTMRSDFLGDCTQFAGLAEAINAGLYLVPRLTPEERRDAIVNPIRVQGAEIEPVLVNRLVNDVGDNPDQLSILQHALNRTWAKWQQEEGKGPLALRHYESIGTMDRALDAHAEEVYAELATAGQEPSRWQRICEKLFQALTDKATDGRGVRRPTTLGSLCAMAEASAGDMSDVIEVFRQPGRCFLMPPVGESLQAETVIDISHESLMRVWKRLKRWVEEEAEAAQVYRRLVQSASLHRKRKASTLQDPELTFYRMWRQEFRPNPTWAKRYGAEFEVAMEFLDRSVDERNQEVWRKQDKSRWSTGGAFVVRPSGEKSNSLGEPPINFDKVDKELISAALSQVGLTAGTTGEFIQQGDIRSDIFRELLVADLVIADISIHNAHAFYELGIRHALKSQYTVMIKSAKRGDPHVFDLKDDRFLTYDPDNPSQSIKALVKKIIATLNKRNPDSPLFQLLPGLTSFDPDKVVFVPLKFREQVELVATRREDTRREELLILCKTLAGQPWEKEGLRLIGEAQFELGDHENSARTYERIREFDMFDVHANQKLATIYQKLKKLTQSDQAAERALQSSGLTDWECSETLSLVASNWKTRWHNAVEVESDPYERQRKALSSPYLEKSLEMYMRAFERTRGHYYSGLNAVAMQSVQIELAKLHPEEWALNHDDEHIAAMEIEKRADYLAKLVAATELAIESSIRNYPEDEWATLSRADLMLLTSNNPKKVALNYQKCVPMPAFNADSLRRQLKIYQDLELFQENVNAVLKVIQ
jgi:tetratricopeptide (TPR) repeat protein